MQVLLVPLVLRQYRAACTIPFSPTRLSQHVHDRKRPVSVPNPPGFSTEVCGAGMGLGPCEAEAVQSGGFAQHVREAEIARRLPLPLHMVCSSQTSNQITRACLLQYCLAATSRAKQITCVSLFYSYAAATSSLHARPTAHFEADNACLSRRVGGYDGRHPYLLAPGLVAPYSTVRFQYRTSHRGHVGS